MSGRAYVSIIPLQTLPLLGVLSQFYLINLCYFFNFWAEYTFIFQWMLASEWLVKLPWEVSGMFTVLLVLVFKSFNIIYLGIIVITPYFFCLTFQRPDDLFLKVLIPSSILTSSGMGFWYFFCFEHLNYFFLKKY